MKTVTFPSKLQGIPGRYLRPRHHEAGKLVNLYYDTYESFNYEDHRQKLHKRAVVYLPANYSPDRQYNVFYLMHGGWSDETTYLGTPAKPEPFKNVLDNAIADGAMEAMIVVCPTYNNLSNNDSSDYGLALRLTDNYYHELENDLIPAVEGHFSTYATDVTPAGLTASRDHRAFCGFSMGSVTTWRVFQHSLHYFRYFLPSSGAITSSGQLMADYVTEQGYGPQDFFIFAASGTADFAYRGFTRQIQAMTTEAGTTFKQAEDENDGNLYYLVAPGGTHSWENATEDFYNGMIQLWKEG